MTNLTIHLLTVCPDLLLYTIILAHCSAETSSGMHTVESTLVYQFVFHIQVPIKDWELILLDHFFIPDDVVGV